MLRAGVIPRHIGFIMDGNRRYAKEQGLKKEEGHRQGLKSLKLALEYCLELGVEVVTTYAFSL